jgi:hypothetical protein
VHRVIERIINLLAFLLTVGRPVTADEIRHTVAGYDEKSDEAFRRTFERDQDLIRSPGAAALDFTDAYEVKRATQSARGVRPARSRPHRRGARCARLAARGPARRDGARRSSTRQRRREHR